MEEPIINRVANSPLLSIDLKDLRPAMPRMELDIAPILFQGMILREKDLREFVKDHDWSLYDGAAVYLHCSEDAIIAQWAWMLLATKLSDHASIYCFGNMEALEQAIWQQAISLLDLTPYIDQKVIIKGCSDVYLPTFVWTELPRKLMPVVQSLMYGEPCSNVPIYKRKKA